MVAAKILKSIAPYADIEIIEEYFRNKKEVSGTAKKIAQSLNIQADAIKTVRAGGVVGRHEILMIFEMTHPFGMVPALMLGTLVSQSVARLAGKHNFYGVFTLHDLLRAQAAVME